MVSVVGDELKGEKECNESGADAASWMPPIGAHDAAW